MVNGIHLINEYHGIAKKKEKKISRHAEPLNKNRFPEETA